MLNAIVGVVVVVLGGLVGYVTSWLNRRMAIADDVRVARAETYEDIWRLSSAVPSWPRADLTADDLRKLQCDLRDWYFGVNSAPADTSAAPPAGTRRPGGMYLSEDARTRYTTVQESIGNIAARSAGDATVDDRDYTAVRKAFSVFRTELTRDLLSRRRGLRSKV